MRNKYYMKEYWHFNGDYNVIFNLIEVNTENKTATVAINNLGKLTQQTVELRGERDNPYFEYGVMNDKIFIDDFESIEEMQHELSAQNGRYLYSTNQLR